MGLLTPPKSEHKFSPTPTSMNNLSALYQKALLEQRGVSTTATAPAAAAAPTDMTSIYQSHRAMLDTVSLLSNLNSMNVNNGTDVDVGIKLESAEK